MTTVTTVRLGRTINLTVFLRLRTFIYSIRATQADYLLPLKPTDAVIVQSQVFVRYLLMDPLEVHPMTAATGLSVASARVIRIWGRISCPDKLDN